MNKRTVINHLDPRAGLWLLLMANIGMFCQKNSEQGSMLSGIFLLLMLVHGLYKAAGKGIILLVSFHLLLMYVFPQCPAWMNMVFPVLVNYSLRIGYKQTGDSQRCNCSGHWRKWCGEINICALSLRFVETSWNCADQWRANIKQKAAGAGLPGHAGTRPSIVQ